MTGCYRDWAFHDRSFSGGVGAISSGKRRICHADLTFRCSLDSVFLKRSDDSPHAVLLPRVSSCVDRSSFGFVGGALLSAWITGFFRGG